MRPWLSATLACALGCSAADAPEADAIATPDANATADATADATANANANATADANATANADANADAAPPKCPALLCEDFESTADGALPEPWTRAAGAGTIAVSSALAHRGKKSLKIVAPSGSYETYIKETVTFPAKGNVIWGRVWFRVEELLPKDFVHWNLIEARGKETKNRIRYGGINNPHGGSFFTNAFLFNVETMGMGEKAIDDDPKPEVPAKTWICVEWMFDGGKQEARLFWDGVERPKMHATASWFETKYQMPTFDSLYLGWAIYQPLSKPYDVSLDDLAIGESRIGCD